MVVMVGIRASMQTEVDRSCEPVGLLEGSYLNFNFFFSIHSQISYTIGDCECAHTGFQPN